MTPAARKGRLPQAAQTHAAGGRMLSVFRRLASSGAMLAAGGRLDGETAISACHNTAKGGKRPDGAIITAEADDVRAWLAQGLIEARGDGYVLADTGRAWLRRQLASSDAFQQQHQVRAAREVDFGGTKMPAIVNDGESPLAWLASRKDKNGVPLLAPFQFQAGERLRADYYYAGLTARVTASWNLAASSKGSGASSNDLATLTDNVLAARQRVVRALAAVGPELSGILVDVCCHLKGLEEAEKVEGWPQRSGKVVLQIALTRLARHYGLISSSQFTAGLSHKIRHWGTDDYRPEIGGGEEGG